MTDRTYRLSLFSTFEESEKVPGFVTDIQEHCNLSEDIASNLMLLLSEAVSNAIHHGNRDDASRKVEIQVVVGAEKVAATVKDEGKGFDPASERNPLSEENLLNPGGRGIFLINEISDEVKYLDGGSTIRFTLIR